MCTALALNSNKAFYFGRNMDIEYSFGERIVIVPKNVELGLKNGNLIKRKHNIMGVATVVSNYPLMAEGINDSGLGVASLNFPGYAKYLEVENLDKKCIAPYEVIPWILSEFSSVDEVRKKIKTVKIVNVPFIEGMPVAELHYIVSDKNGSITIEQTEDGLKVYENPVGILANNPTFDYHMLNLNNYISISNTQPKNMMEEIGLKHLGQGAGSNFLPGGFGTTSRFVRATFLKLNSEDECSNEGVVSQFFHILDNVAFVKGSVRLESGEIDLTTYAICYNIDEKIAYYKTYSNNQITAVKMENVDLNSKKIIEFEMRKEQNIFYQN